MVSNENYKYFIRQCTRYNTIQHSVFWVCVLTCCDGNIEILSMNKSEDKHFCPLQDLKHETLNMERLNSRNWFNGTNLSLISPFSPIPHHTSPASPPPKKKKKTKPKLRTTNSFQVSHVHDRDPTT